MFYPNFPKGWHQKFWEFFSLNQFRIALLYPTLSTLLACVLRMYCIDRPGVPESSEAINYISAFICFMQTSRGRLKPSRPLTTLRLFEAGEPALSTQNRGSNYGPTIHPIDTRTCMIYLHTLGLVTRSSRFFICKGGFVLPGVTEMNEGVTLNPPDI